MNAAQGSTLQGIRTWLTESPRQPNFRHKCGVEVLLYR
jgi:hypothetical protein